MTEKVPVGVCIVTRDSRPDLARCLRAVAGLRPPPAEVVIVDCASRDGSAEEARRQAAGLPLRVIELDQNVGFAEGFNRAIAACRAPWILSLNADAWPEPDYVAKLLARAETSARHRIGALTGRLYRPTEGRSDAPRLDACGMRLTATWRHLDRASGEVDRGQYPNAQRVFGATGAASLFRREALEDVAIDGVILDPDFFAYREDAELCFRLRERGWEIVYEPAAAALHRRFNLPLRRSQMPGEVNFHSLKNRYLLRAYHQGLANLAMTLLPTLARDLIALLWVLMRERSSLPAYAWLWRRRREILRRRRLIRAQMTERQWSIDRWFWRDGAPLD